jgi:hypothetical protein
MVVLQTAPFPVTTTNQTTCRAGEGDPTVIFDRRNPNRAAADRYAREILSIDLPLAGSSSNLSS